jgi:pimeloyl-ACP methyl ester carboxylesterase
LQFLIFPTRYWDSTLSPSTYSYVASALDAGYTILTYDRLGTGLSTKPNAYTHLQVSLELEILRGLSTLALSGSLLTHAKFCDTPQDVASTLRSLKYTKLVHVGHSFGSILTTALAAIYPSITSTIVLTGWIPNNHARDFGISSFGLVYAGQPGYVKQGNQSYVEAAFFHEPFSLAALRYATKIRAPVGVVETVSVTPFVSISGSGFTGSVLYVLAEFDALICGGDCNPLYLGINGLMSYLWQTAGRREHYLVKGAGHGLALHPSAPQGYEVIRTFLEG